MDFATGKAVLDVVLNTKNLIRTLQRIGMEEVEPGKNPVSDAVRPLINGVLYNVVYNGFFSWFELKRMAQNQLGEVDVLDLREKTDGEKRWISGKVTCTGMFMPGSLLNLGWWEKKRAGRDAAASAPEWRGISGVQSWLNHGFFNWGPSWDLNHWEGESDTLLFGQIGREDEADSIPVIIADPKKAKECRETLTAVAKRDGRLVSHATVKGKLYSLRDLMRYNGDDDTKSFIDALIEKKAIRTNCIVVDRDHSDKERHRHRLDIEERQPEEPYSGYMWKAVCPAEVKDAENQLPHSYFVWEHTNFANKDAINYNIESMNAKIRYIAERCNGGNGTAGMTLLQQMMPEDRLRGEPGTASYERPAVAVDEFMKQVTAASACVPKRRK